MDESTISCWLLVLGLGACLMFFRAYWTQKHIDAACEEWQQAGYDIECTPAVVYCYSTLPARKERRRGLGILSIADGNLLLRTLRGETEVIPLNDVCWIAVGNMWRRTIGRGKFGPHLIVDYETSGGRETLAFHSRGNLRLGQHLSQYHQLPCRRIPHGFRIWNGRLIRPG